MKPVLKIDFSDFGTDKNANFITRALSTRWDVRISDFPDVLVYSDFGEHHRLHTCRKVYYTNESTRADWSACDYALLCSEPQDPREYRLPNYVLLGDPAALVKDLSPQAVERLAASKTDFCACVISQDHGKKTRNRIDFFHRLSRYKKVSSGGRMLNNVGRRLGPAREDKLAFLRPHKFMISFENGSFPGYATEKIADAMEAGCIPIYWGDPLVHRDFNPASFLRAADFPSVDHLIARIVQIDNDPALHRSILAEPWFHGNVPNEAFSAERLCDFFEKILADPKPPVAARTPSRRFFGNWFRWIPVKRDKIPK